MLRAANIQHLPLALLYHNIPNQVFTREEEKNESKER